MQKIFPAALLISAALLTLLFSAARAQDTVPSQAFLVFAVEVKDAAKWREYVNQAGSTIEAFGGELVVRGAFNKVLSGDPPEHKLGGVIRFPSVEAIDKWYASEAYSPLIPLREQAAVVHQTIYTVSE